MSAKQKQGSGESGGSQRATEIHDAMLNIPGYADDGILFIVRYGSLAKNTLRQADYDEFMARLQTMNEHWFKSGHGEGAVGDDESTTANPSDPRSVKAAELKALTLEKIRDFPDLVRDFDKFTRSTRAVGSRYRK